MERINYFEIKDPNNNILKCVVDGCCVMIEINDWHYTIKLDIVNSQELADVLDYISKHEDCGLETNYIGINPTDVDRMYLNVYSVTPTDFEFEIYSNQVLDKGVSFTMSLTQAISLKDRLVEYGVRWTPNYFDNYDLVSGKEHRCD